MKTFTWIPFYTPSVSDSHNVKTSIFESGVKQKRYKGRKPSIWKLKFKTTFTEMVEIRSFYNEVRGSYESFLWTEPYTRTAKIVRFIEDNLEIESEFKRNGSFEFSFEEVL